MAQSPAMQDIGGPAVVYALVFIFVLPLLALKSKRRLDAGAPVPPRAARMRATLILQGLMILLGVMLERQWEMGLLPPPAPLPETLLWAAGLLALLVASMPLRWASSSADERQRLALSMPHNGREMVAWVAISCAAGFGEELNYRGVLVAILWAITGNWWLAVALSIAAFAVAHVTQSWRKAAFVAGFSVLFQWVIVASGSLLPAMLAHAAYDIAAGIVFGRLTRNLPVPAAERPAS